jgi:hypothetical protein
MKPQTRIRVDRYIKRITFKHLSMQPKGNKIIFYVLCEWSIGLCEVSFGLCEVFFGFSRGMVS